MQQHRTARHKKMLRHILVKRMKMVASMPTSLTKSCSVVVHSGLIQEKKPFPSWGGACLSSACLSLGAYTTVLSGLTREKPKATATVMLTEEPRAA